MCRGGGLVGEFGVKETSMDCVVTVVASRRV